MNIDKEETLKNIKKHLQKIVDDKTKSSLESIFSELLQKEEDSIAEIKKRVDTKITNFKDDKQPVIYQSYLRLDENLPEKYFEILPTKHKISKTPNTEFYEIETDDYSTENWTTLTSVLLFDTEALNDLCQNISVSHKAYDIEFKIEKSKRFNNEIKLLKKYFNNINLDWDMPYLPYSNKVYDIKIKLQSINDNREKVGSFGIDNNEPIEIQFSLESSNKWCLGVRIIWNIENIEQQVPRNGKEKIENGKDIFRYSLTIPENDFILPKEPTKTFERNGNKYEITIPKNDNFNYDYLRIHHLEEYKIYKNSKSNKKKKTITQVIQVKSRADIESIINSYEDLDNIKLMDYKLDDRSVDNPNSEKPYYEIKEFDLTKRGILTLNISCKKEDLTSDKIDFICAKIQEKMASYWCISKVEYE